MDLNDEEFEIVNQHLLESFVAPTEDKLNDQEDNSQTLNFTKMSTISDFINTYERHIENSVNTKHFQSQYTTTNQHIEVNNSNKSEFVNSEETINNYSMSNNDSNAQESR